MSPDLGSLLAARGSTGLVAASLFSGLGGGCLGWTAAGFDVRYASEFIPEAADSYEAWSGIRVDRRDVRAVSGAEIVDACGGRVDLLEGSPPCSPFSASGIREAGWNRVRPYSSTEQRVDDLFGEFLRLISEVRPRAVVAENVAGLAAGNARGYLLEILRGVAALGYRVEARMVSAAELGVAQVRRRIFIQGVRDDVGSPAWPTPAPRRVTIRDAVPWISDPEAHGPGPVGPDERGVPFGSMAIGREWRRLAPGSSSDRYFNLIRAHPDRPAPTITQTGGSTGAASVAHPFAPRKFSIPELRRLFGYPDDMPVTGTYRQRYERFGRSVCPPVTAALGRALAPILR